MKFNKNTLIVLTAGIIVIGLAVSGWTYMQAAGEKQKLENDLAAAQKKLAAINLDELTTQSNQLTQEIQKNQAEKEALEASLAFPGESLGTTEIIIAEAADCNLILCSIESPGWGIKPLSGTSFEILSLKIRVQGEMQDMANYISRLSQRFPTGIAESVQIKANNAASTTTPEAGTTPVTSSTPETTPTPTALPSPTPNAEPIPVPSEIDGYTADITLLIYNYMGDQNVE